MPTKTSTNAVTTPKTMNAQASNVPDPGAGVATSVEGCVSPAGLGVGGGGRKLEVPGVGHFAHRQGHAVDVRGRHGDAFSDRDLKTEDQASGYWALKSANLHGVKGSTRQKPPSVLV